MAYRDVVLADAPAGYWRLDESTGPAASSGTVALSLTATGGPTFGATSGPGLGTAVLFDGVDDHLRHATAADANNLRRASAAPSYSLEAWVMPTNVTGTAGIYVHRLAAASTQAALFLGAGGQVLVDLGNGTAGSGRWASAYSVPAGQWTHLVATYDSATTTWRLYANGVLVDTLVRAAPATVATSGFASIGAATTNGTAAAFFPGRVDEVAVYPGVALPAQRVAAHYAAGQATVTRSGGSTAVVQAVATGNGRSRRRGGTTAPVAAAAAGTGRARRTGAAVAVVTGVALGQGTKHARGTTVAPIAALASAAGRARRRGSATAPVLVSATGAGSVAGPQPPDLLLVMTADLAPTRATSRLLAVGELDATLVPQRHTATLKEQP